MIASTVAHDVKMLATLEFGLKGFDQLDTGREGSNKREGTSIHCRAEASAARSSPAIRGSP
jgi:hypothetical protein